MSHDLSVRVVCLCTLLLLRRILLEFIECEKRSCCFHIDRHPFSITSAPGDDYLSVHVRTAGDWTQELKRIFIENYFSPCSIGRATFSDLGSVQQRRSRKSICFIEISKTLCVRAIKLKSSSLWISLPRLLVDGPYGAPAQDFRNYDVLLLVGLGIGATPFISILRDLLNNIKIAEELMVWLHIRCFRRLLVFLYYWSSFCSNFSTWKSNNRCGAKLLRGFEPKRQKL